MAYELNRLAWGLVREELRRAKKSMTGHKEVMQRFIELGKSTFNLNKRLQPVEVTRFSYIMRHFIQRNFHTFAERHERIPILGCSKKSDVSGFFYWWPSDKENFGAAVEFEDPQYVEPTLDLRYQRFSVERRRLIYDSSFCNVTIGEHALYRMIDRGYVGKEPLSAFSESYLDLMALTLVMHHSHMLTDGQNRTVLIPFGSGLLIGRMVFILDEDVRIDRSHLRFQVDNKGYRNLTVPSQRHLKHEVNGRVGELAIQIQTYIDRPLMEANQIWVHNRIQEFITRYRDDLSWLALLLCTPESIDLETGGQITDDNAQEIVDKLRDDMAKLMNHTRWRSACNAPQVVR
jgi:hypothetical protein